MQESWTSRAPRLASRSTGITFMASAPLARQKHAKAAKVYHGQQRPLRVRW
jgi:hypothetical protein